MSAGPSTTGQESRCPNCGGPLRFGGAHSLATVCSYCRSAVARHGVDLELLGKVPDLVATDTRLSLGLTGRVGSASFNILGHLQLARVDGADEGGGDAAWDEWYAGFSDGTWGWLAEAQGRLLLTRPADPMAGGRAPTFPFDALQAGRRIDEPGIGVLAVEEVGHSRFVAAEGELPFAPRLGATYRFADLTASDGRFFTFDYGAEGDGDDAAQVFAGRRLEYDEASLGAIAGRPPVGGSADEGMALACPHCGASLSLKNPESVTFTCPSCRSLLDGSQGAPRILKHLASREQPAIPIGSRGALDGETCEVLGWMRRSTEVDGTTYYWDEYLLHSKRGYRWLTEGDGQWHLVSPIDAGRVSPAGAWAECEGRRFKHFQDAQARYETMQGEFYWRVAADRRVATADYVAPPHILSSENDGREESWSLGRWVAPGEVWAAFNLTGDPPPAAGIGAAQPNPHKAAGRRLWAVAGIALVAHLVALFVVAAALSGERVLSVDVPLAASAPPTAPAPPLDGNPAPAPAPGGAEPNVFVSDPFELPAARQAVEIRARANCEQSWVGLDTALIHDETGESQAVGIDLSYYHGYEGGESWSEGSRSGSEVLGGLARGRYLLRVEPQFGKDPSGRLPETVHVEVIRGPFRGGPAWFVIVALLVWPLITALRSLGFEKRRWQESDHPMVQSS